MVTKWCLLFFVCTSLLAHKIEGINLLMTPLENDMILIEGRMKGSQKKLEGNKVALISMIDKRILFEGFLESGKPLHVTIPKESYWVYLYVGDQDIVEEGIAPKGGFHTIATSQKERALKTMTGLTLGFMALFLIMVCVRLYRYQK